MNEKVSVPHVAMEETARLIDFDVNCRKIVNEYKEYDYYFDDIAAQQFNSALLKQYQETKSFKIVQRLSHIDSSVTGLVDANNLPHGFHFTCGAALGIHLARTTLGDKYDDILSAAITNDLPAESNSYAFIQYTKQLMNTGVEYYQDHYEFTPHSMYGKDRISTVITPVIDAISQTINFSEDGEQLYKSGFATICRYIDLINDTSEYAAQFDELVYRFGPLFSDRE